ncbi:MAG TPA: hypothetical protein VF494_05345 [Candidatus Limnocylindrales bacterium]
MKRSWLASLLVLALMACGNPAPSAVPILQQAAEAAAIAQADGTNVHVVSTRLSSYGAVAGSGAAVDANTPVWVVVLSGTFPVAACGTPSPTSHPCTSTATSAQVLIDARTGAFIRSDLPAPSAT